MRAIHGHVAGITRDQTRRFVGVGGTPPDALASHEALPQPAIEEWKQAIDAMLAWRSRPEQFDAEDRPDEAILETALDYAVDQTEGENGHPSPSSIVPSGSGRIAMEWNDGPRTVIVEFIEAGVATYTLFNQGRLEIKNTLARNPTSRKLEPPG